MTHIKKNINNYNDDNNTDLTFLLDKYSNIFLKMDIEGKEIDWIDAVDLNLLKNIKQIVIEIHDTDKNKFKVLQALKKLGTTHYIIHSHGNNNDGITNKIPHVLELSMIRKDLLNELKFNTTNLPSKLDFPNNINSSEIVLNYEPFFYKEEINNHNLN